MHFILKAKGHLLNEIAFFRYICTSFSFFISPSPLSLSLSRYLASFFIYLQLCFPAARSTYLPFLAFPFNHPFFPIAIGISLHLSCIRVNKFYSVQIEILATPTSRNA